jgi:glycopeptide antibiotics resistance protein
LSEANPHLDIRYSCIQYSIFPDEPTFFGSGLSGLCIGVLVSIAVETCQLFLLDRDSSPIDVATNALGTLLGAAGAAYQRARGPQEQMSLLFAFEIPLMNVVYLLVPLLWLG